MKKKFCIVIFLSLVIISNAQNHEDFPYQNGDLLFQDLDCGELCDAIEKVSPALGNKRFSHVGLVYVVGDSIWVIEAIDKDVHLTRIHQFLQRQTDTAGNPKVVVGRLKKAYRKLNSRALGFALKQNGKPYDDAFIYDNGKYYCSELIYDAYKEANDGLPFFHLYPMSFKDTETKKTFPAWKKYYKDIGEKIPEGRLGCNPGSIAISESVEIVSSFY